MNKKLKLINVKINSIFIIRIYYFAFRCEVGRSFSILLLIEFRLLFVLYVAFVFMILNEALLFDEYILFCLKFFLSVIGGESITDNSCNISLSSSVVVLLISLQFFLESYSFILYFDISEFRLNDLFL